MGRRMSRGLEPQKRCALAGSAIQFASMPETTVRVRRRYWTVISGALALAVVTWPTVACRSKNPIPLPPTKAQPLDDEQPPPGQAYLVLVWMETAPPGARIVRASDGYVLGYSPEIIEFHYTKKPVQIRFELEGYLPLTQEVSAAVDAELKFVLEPIPKAPPPATKKSKGSKRHRNSN